MLFSSDEMEINFLLTGCIFFSFFVRDIIKDFYKIVSDNFMLFIKFILNKVVSDIVNVNIIILLVEVIYKINSKFSLYFVL